MSEQVLPRTPRLRMFAGPNGSGKSTIKAQVEERLWGHYINPDDIEAQIKAEGSFDLALWGLEAVADQAPAFFTGSTWLEETGRGEAARAIRSKGSFLDFSGVEMDSYLASVLADFLRKRLLDKREDFTFETVMSAKDKVDFLAFARSCGYRTYLYYVCTDDVRINIARVQNRVGAGGHPVPEHLIRKRYDKSLALLLHAIRVSDRAYLFDNSIEAQPGLCFAEFEDDQLIIRSDPQPRWFQTAVLDKLNV